MLAILRGFACSWAMLSIVWIVESIHDIDVPWPPKIGIMLFFILLVSPKENQ